MSTLKYLGKRFVRIVITLFFVVSILFVLFRVLPGDPFATVLSKGMTQETINRLRDQFGLNEPLYIQYIVYIKNLFTFQFGQSFISLKPVWSILQYRLINTLYLMLVSILATYVFAFYFGAIMAWNRGKKIDSVGTVISVLGQGIPPFVSGLLFILIFSLVLGWFPVGGMSASTVARGGVLETLTSGTFWHHLFLPFLTNSFFFLVTPTLLMRNSMIEELETNYIDYLHAKGIPERRIMYWHAARNSLLPFLTQVALMFGFMIGGTVLVETVFSWPGMGKLLVDSVLSKDYPVAQASFFLIALIVMLANFAVDVLYSVLDPRIEQEVN